MCRTNWSLVQSFTFQSSIKSDHHCTRFDKLALTGDKTLRSLFSLPVFQSFHWLLRVWKRDLAFLIAWDIIKGAGLSLDVLWYRGRGQVRWKIGEQCTGLQQLSKQMKVWFKGSGSFHKMSRKDEGMLVEHENYWKLGACFYLKLNKVQ